MARVATAGGRPLWEPENISGSTLSVVTQALSGAQRVAGIFRAPKSGNLSRISFQCTSLSGSPTLYARLESLGSDWKPSGTIIAAGASGTITPAVGANTVILTTPYAATVNELIAAVVGYDSGATSASIGVRATGPYLRSLPGFALDTGTGSYSLGAGRPGVMAVYDDNEYAALAHVVADANTTSFGTASSPNERGNKITPLLDYTCVGVDGMVRDNGSASTDICLYDSAGTLLRSVSHTPASTPTTSPIRSTWYWAPVTLSAGQVYYLTSKVVSGSGTIVWISYNSEYGRRAITTEAWQATRTSGGAWTESPEALVALVPLITDISASGGGGGGGLILPRSMNGGYAA